MQLRLSLAGGRATLCGSWSTGEGPVLFGLPQLSPISSPAVAKIRQYHQYVSLGTDTGHNVPSHRHPSRFITTLRPESLTRNDFVDMSGLTACTLRITANPTDAETGVASQYITYPAILSCVQRGLQKTLEFRTQGHIPRTMVAFPEGTQGFLYYFNPPFAPPYLGQIRFRITASSDPASFSSGRDLRCPYSAIPMYWALGSMISHKSYLPLIGLLQKDRLVTDETIKQAAQIWRGKRHTWPSRILYAFNQPFHFDFQTQRIYFDIAGTEDGKPVLERGKLEGPASNSNRDGPLPFNGSAICCFVQAADGSTRVQFLKILELTKVPDVPCRMPRPEEGELMHTRSGRIWQYTLPKTKGRDDSRRPLRLLQKYPGVSYDMF